MSGMWEDVLLTEVVNMRRLKLVLIGIKDCWGNESVTYFKCPKCERGVITYWKDNTIGYRMSEWYKCPVCGFDADSGEWERFVVRAPMYMYENKRPICPRCESESVCVRRDMSLVCRCGYDSRRDENE